MRTSASSATPRSPDGCPRGWELVPAAGAVEALREVKDAEELQRIAAAARSSTTSWPGSPSAGSLGAPSARSRSISSTRCACAAPRARAFRSIVAAGPHGALPHAEPRDVEIPRDVLVTIDLGAIVDGYCSDCTRTFATGRSSPRRGTVYELVLRAQRAGVAAVTAGRPGATSTRVARAVIEEAGYGESLRSRPRARRRHRDPRGSAAGQDGRRRAAAGRERRHRRAGDLPARPTRRAHRGSRRRHRRAAPSRLSHYPTELTVVD